MRVDLFGCPIDILGMTETVELAKDSGDAQSNAVAASWALNVAKFVNMRSDPVLRSDVMGSDLIGIDGMGIVFALRMFGVPVKERVAGVDLFQQLLKVCANDGFRPFLLGATPDVLYRAADAISRSMSTDTDCRIEGWLFWSGSGGPGRRTDYK